MITTGTKAREIVKDADKINEMLNSALADEWLAVYQYWAGAKVVRGIMRPDVQEELEEHYKEELEHADMLADRIIQLGGDPILDIKEIHEKSRCGFDAPSDPAVLKILEQNIKGEQCAIQVYHEILEKIKLSGDPITFHIIRKIMQDEVDHEQELQDLRDDISMS